MGTPQICELGDYTYPYVSREQWTSFFSKYTEGTYSGEHRIYHYRISTIIIRELFEDKDVGKVGLQYLVAWSIYRQLAKFTDPYLLGYFKKDDETCFQLVKDVMRLAILSHYFQKQCEAHGVRSQVSTFGGPEIL
ncbi:hypothetical protein HPB52_021613 [Rhipicephalus sanguineus]|uniref:Uncharacterized protein n=1 Tax=Rhipicephalus sanguineus TaxID=34632 RepID=A0A9D4QB93_RHISA|nr:hypothetical protein HPB52_021613 [Rhipicephalus sanguineus]